MENETDISQLLSPKGTFPAAVAKVIDDYKLVINRGKENKIEEGQRMLVYRLSNEEIKDPHTGESLGYLELVRGTGRIIFVQDKYSILESDKYEDDFALIRRLADTFNLDKTSRKRLPFDHPKAGDQVKPI